VESTIEMRAMVIFNVEIDIDINIAKGARGESFEQFNMCVAACAIANQTIFLYFETLTRSSLRELAN